MSEIAYVLQNASASECPTCTSRAPLLKLLTPKNETIYGPSFYICFKCGMVGEVGRGQVNKGLSAAGWGKMRLIMRGRSPGYEEPEQGETET